LKTFIGDELKRNKKGMNFDSIYRMVANEYKNFYNKDFVFKVIDELF
jgi:hypothetical protein